MFTKFTKIKTLINFKAYLTDYLTLGAQSNFGTYQKKKKKQPNFLGWILLIKLFKYKTHLKHIFKHLKHKTRLRSVFLKYMTMFDRWRVWPGLWIQVTLCPVCVQHCYLTYLQPSQLSHPA